MMRQLSIAPSEVLRKETINFYTHSAKLYSINHYAWNAMTMPVDTLQALELSHPRWMAIEKVYERFIVDEPQKVLDSYIGFSKNWNISVGCMVATSD
jgi:hypothetical protein